MTIYASVTFDYWVVVSKKSAQYYLLSEKFSEFLIWFKMAHAVKTWENVNLASKNLICQFLVDFHTVSVHFGFMFET